MLPGFRFLFAAIVLTLSILVFGLGAAALLRAAHEEFAAKPSWRAAPEPKFAQAGEAPVPMLAMLRLEPVPVEEKASDSIPAAASAEPPAIAVVPAEPDNVAALKPDDADPPETAKPETPARETSVREAAPAEPPAPAGEARIAAAEQILPPANETVPSPPEQAIAPDAEIAALKIATLGGPAVVIEAQPPSKAASAKSDRSAVKKRLQARRAKERRRLALRARQAAAQQQAADPFAQPTVNLRSR